MAGQAAGATSPSEKPVAGADAAWAMDGRGMDTTGEAPTLQCADIQRQQWHRRCRLDRRDHGTARLHVWLRLSVSIVGQRVALTECREAALTARDVRGYCDSTCRLKVSG